MEIAPSKRILNTEDKDAFSCSKTSYSHLYKLYEGHHIILYIIVFIVE